MCWRKSVGQKLDLTIHFDERTGSQHARYATCAAVGMKTSLKTIFEVGGQATLLIVAETLFLAIFILAGLAWFA